jgi:transcriptional regulator with XRE-family HTH domain
MSPQKVNTKWFRAQLAANDMSMRRLAKLLELDPSAVSLMLRGKRTMTADEANRISGLLTVPVTEVLAQAGIPIEEDARSFTIKAWVDANSTLRSIAARNARRVTAPRDVPGAGMAVQIRAPETVTDGWVLFSGAFDTRVEALINRLCIAEIMGEGHVIGSLKRGYDDEKFNLVPFTGAAPIENVAVRAAAPVLWIRPV